MYYNYKLYRTLNECNYPQQVLLSKAIEIIKEDLLARLACSGVSKVSQSISVMVS